MTATRFPLTTISRAWLIGVLLCVLVSAGEAQAVAPQAPPMQITCKARGIELRVRPGPDVNYTPVQVVSVNTQYTVRVDGRNAETTWLHITGNPSGWVLAGEVLCQEAPLGDLNVLQVTTKPAQLAPLSQKDGPPPEYKKYGVKTAQSNPNIQWVIEYDVDRGQSVYSEFDLAAPMPELCKLACEREDRCQAYVYTEPGLRADRAHCWLKDKVPAAVARAGYISGYKTLGAWEEGIDREGNDLGPEFSVNSAQECMNRCRSDARCAALAFVPHAAESSAGLCWLKSAAAAPAKLDGCLSAIKRFGAVHAGPNQLIDPAPAARCTGNLDFQDGFNRNQLGPAWTADPPWRLQSIATRPVLQGSGRGWATVQGRNWGDFQFSTWVVLERGTLHLNVRRQGQARYIIGLQRDHLYLQRQQGASPRALTDKSTPFKFGEWRLVQIAVRGGHIEVFVDGVEVLDHTDTNPLGPGAFAFETLANSAAQLDDVQVCVR